jgi:hypothetical protein
MDYIEPVPKWLNFRSEKNSKISDNFYELFQVPQLRIYSDSSDFLKFSAHLGAQDLSALRMIIFAWV